jgi:predicted DNA-binding transcriptional regulator YafY
MVAFLGRRLWSQAELARRVGVGTEALRKLLYELMASGTPLTCEKDHPHVYWRMPPTWFPGGVLFKQEDVPDLLRQLQRLPRSKMRDRLLAIVTEQLPVRVSPVATPVVSRATNEQEELYVPIVEDAAAKKRPLAMRYLTAGRAPSQRYASVQLLDYGPPARFIATCHRNGDLRWFRVDAIIHARLDGQEPFRECPKSALDAFRGASLDGFKGEGAPVACSFFIRKPESDWVANNLLEGMRAETMHDGVRVHVETSAVLRLARFVVGLGGAATCESSALGDVVAELARGALQQLQSDADSAGSPAIPDARRRGPVQPPSDV